MSVKAGQPQLAEAHRAAQRCASLEQVARAHGLYGVRDSVVLAAIGPGRRQAQLPLGPSFGVGKTTLTSLPDRIEAAGLVHPRARQPRQSRPHPTANRGRPAARGGRRTRRGGRNRPDQVTLCAPRMSSNRPSFSANRAS
jgi:hypothetical protein